MREYDPVIGRWLVPDPYGQYWSPYVGMGNDPINSMDPNGGLSDGPGDEIPTQFLYVDITVTAQRAGFFGRAVGFFEKHAETALNVVQFGLDVAGMVPVLGAIPDLVNADISLARGNFVEAGASAFAAIPGIGDVVGATKIEACGS